LIIPEILTNNHKQQKTPGKLKIEVQNKAGRNKEKGPRRFTPQALLDPPVRY
jgi:hypothetical protein